jgi:preprotein translocase subunit SecD
VIEINFTEAGTKVFAKVTRENTHKQLAIIIDGQICEVPMIASEIPSGEMQIDGSFTKQQTKALATKISAALAR